MVERQRALNLVARYNITWDASQSLAELLRLESAVAAYAVPNTDSSKEQIKLRLDIVSNRVGLLRSGQVKAVLEFDPDLKQSVTELDNAIKRISILLPNLDQPGAVAEVLRLLTPLNSKLTRLASIANMLDGERVARDQRQLSRLHWVLSGTLGALFICAIGLVLLLLRHNELLARAQRELRALATDLEKAGGELAAANQAVRQANAELQVQYLALQERDRELEVQNERFDAALNNMSQALCMVDANERIIVCNRRFAELLGIPAAFITPGEAVADVIGAACRASPADRALFTELAVRHRAAADDAKPVGFSCEGVDGRTLAVMQQPMPGGGWVATYEDVTERRRVEERIRHMALHDALTSLPNRVLFRETMDNALRTLPPARESLAVLLLDLDLFKDVNDTLGHPAGDMLLSIVAQRLRRCISHQDMVARLSGDEFAVLQIGVEDRSDCAALAQRTIEVLQAPYDLEGHRVTITASVGIAIAPADGTNPDQLMRRADMALYRAKAMGRATYCFFEAEMEADVQERRLLGLELREAISRREFELFYQPIVSLRDERPIGFEALIRWRHPKRGLVEPGRFIPLAEELGLIGELGEWTLQAACEECARWPDPLRVSVNLSAREVSSGRLVQSVEHILRQTGLPPSRLELEITESVLLQGTEPNLSTLFDLRAMGVSVALDDFGTGYASLSYLNRFRFDKIKVDRSFVKGMVNDPDALAIIQSITELAPRLGMRVTAEGIETFLELEQVHRIGCDEGQGYYFGRPMRAADIGDYLALRLPAGGPVLHERDDAPASMSRPRALPHSGYRSPPGRRTADTRGSARSA